MNTEQARFNMIEQQIRPWDVLDQKVLDLISRMPREEFVPESFRQLAFADIEIPLGHEQFMMAPRVEARMLQSLDIKPGERVLEIGTGSGFVTACLARLGGHVSSLDIFPEFVDRAQRTLDGQGIRNVQLAAGDAFAEPVGGRFDAIAVTGSMPLEYERFRKQLSIGGRLFMVVGESPVMEAILVQRVSEQSWSREILFETDLGALLNAPQPNRFTF
jgi:protein-L-isoaspartate(D-aspartate) O-methyltransferase